MNDLTKKPKPKRRSRIDRWQDAVSRAEDALNELQELWQEYSDWRDSLPENLANSALGEKLDAVVELDIETALSTVQEASGLDLPRGFGKD